MTEQAQTRNWDMDAKMRPRMELLRRLGDAPGRHYVPFCGFGEVQRRIDEDAEVAIDPATILGCDIDVDAVRHWSERWPAARILALKEEKIEAGDYAGEPFRYADVDAFGIPWAALGRFLDRAPLQRRIGVVVTDGGSLHRRYSKRYWDFAAMEVGPIASRRTAEQHANILAEAGAWLESKGFTIVWSGEEVERSVKHMAWMLEREPTALSANGDGTGALAPPGQVVLSWKTIVDPPVQ